MKSKSIFTAVAFAACFGALIQRANAESPVVRDLAVDQALMADGGMSGVLPPTGAQPFPGLLPSGARNHYVDPVIPSMSQMPKGAAESRTDRQARVYEVTGDVKISSPSGSDWEPVLKGMIIKAGQIVLTSKDGSVSVTFDEAFSNVVHVPGGTRAVFRSIEPTDIGLEDGRIYNLFDGLSASKNWTVSTPTAVAAVRGTYFLVQFKSANGDFLSAVFDVPDDHASKIELVDLLANGAEGSSVDIPEGNQIDLTDGAVLDESMLEGIDSEFLEEMRHVLEQLIDERAARYGEILPPTNGEFGDPGSIDPAGNGIVGGPGDIGLDPQLDSGSVQDDPSEFSEEESDSGHEDEGPGDEGPGDEGPGDEGGGDEGGGCEGEDCYE